MRSVGGGRGAGTNYRDRRTSARLFCICFCRSQWYHYLSMVQIDPLIPNPNPSATKSQSFRFSVQVFFLPARPTTCLTKSVDCPKTITSCSATLERAHLLRESRYECDKTPAVVKQVVFLSAFAKSRKAAISFVMLSSVACPALLYFFHFIS